MPRVTRAKKLIALNEHVGRMRRRANKKGCGRRKFGMMHEEKEHHNSMQILASGTQEQTAGWVNKEGQPECSSNSSNGQTMVMPIRKKKKNNRIGYSNSSNTAPKMCRKFM